MQGGGFRNVPLSRLAGIAPAFVNFKRIDLADVLDAGWSVGAWAQASQRRQYRAKGESR